MSQSGAAVCTGSEGGTLSDPEVRTLPDHDLCGAHEFYKLNCGQFERLIARSGQRCEICGRAGTAGPGHNKLHIDHDHSGKRWAVRGLLCTGCNSKLTVKIAENRPPWTVGYLANSWWIKECERLGVAVDIAPEPDFGTVIFDPFGFTWLRDGDGEWRPHGKGRPGISSASWQWIYDHRGPHNMVPVDLYAPEMPERIRSWDYLIWDAERAALQALLIKHETSGGLHRDKRRGHLLGVRDSSCHRQ